MTKRLHGLLALGSLALAMVLASSAQAATLWWNGGTNASGTWDTTTMKWSTASGGALDTVWNNSAVNDASFDSTSAQTITIASGDTINVQNLYCKVTVASAYTIIGGTLNLVGSSVINTDGNGAWGGGIYLKSTITGTNGFTKTGSSYLDLGLSSAVSTYTGTTDIQGGEINPQSDYAFGNSVVRVRNGARVWTWVGRNLVNDFIIDAGGNVDLNGGTQNLRGQITLNGGALNVNGGTLNATGQINVVGSGTIYAGNGWNQQLNLYNSVVGSGANLVMSLTGNASRNHIVTGSIDLGTDGSLTKNLAGILTISGTSDSKVSSWGTLRITEGTVQIGDGSANSGALSAAAQAANINIGYTSYPANWNGQLLINSARSYNFSGVISGTVVDSAPANFVGGIYLAATNTGTVTLSGSANTYNGQTVVNGGVLKLTNSAALGVSSLMLTNGGTGVANAQLSGDISMSNKMTLNGRSTTAAHLINLSGANTVSGDISLQTSGNSYNIESQSGTLTLGNIVNNTATADNRFLNLTGAGNGVVSGSIGNGASTTGAVSVVKSGAGVWTLSGVNTYAGTTSVNAGTLALGSGGSIAGSPVIAVAAGAFFDVSAVSGAAVGASTTQSLQGLGTVKGAFTLGSYGSVNAAGVGSTGTLAFANGLNAASGVLNYDLRSSLAAGNDYLSVTGAMTLGASSIINVNLLDGYLATGSYKLAGYSSLVGTASNANLAGLGSSTSRQSFDLVASGTALTLNVTGSPVGLTWKGSSSASWDVKTTVNWASTAAPEKFYDLDFVTFDDAATVTSVTLNTTVTPAGTIAFNNSTKNYVLSGTGRILGSGTLVKTGAGTLTVSNTGTNAFSGNVVINAGTLSLSEGSTLGVGNSLVDNGTFILNNANDMTWGSSIYTSKTISGTGVFVKSGSGTLTIANANTFAGNISINAGKVVVGNATAFGDLTRASTLSIASGATLDVNTNVAGYVGTERSTVGSMVVSFAGAGVDGKGAITNSGTVESYSAIRAAVMTGDATIGGDAGRYDFGRLSGSYFTGNGHALTKAGTNRIIFVGLGETGLSALNVNEGDFCVQGSTILGTSGSLASVSVASGATFSYWGSINVGNNVALATGGSIGTLLTDAAAGTFSGNVTFAGSGNVTVAGTSTAVFTGAVTSPALYKLGSGTAAFTVANWSGVTTVGSGTLQFGNGGALTYGLTADVMNESTSAVIFNSNNAVTIGNNFVVGSSASAYGLTYAGSGTYRAHGANTYTGATNVNNSATLLLDEVGMPQALSATSGLTISGGSVKSKLTLTSSSPSGSTLSVGPTGMDAITLGGRQPAYVYAHILNEQGKNTISSSINLTSGGDRYVIQSDSGTLVLNGNITNTNTVTARYLYLQGAGAGEMRGSITDGTNSPVNVIKSGAGTWVFASPQTYTGSTTINAGTLTLSGGNLVGSVFVNSGATLYAEGSSLSFGNATVSQVVGGSGTILAPAGISFAEASSGSTFIAPGGNYSIGTLTFDMQGNSLVLTSGATLNIDVSGTASDLLMVKGNESGTLGNAKLNVTFLGSPLKSSYKIVTATSPLSNAISAANITNNTRYTLSTAIGTGLTESQSLSLIVSGSNASLVWNGASSTGVWNVKGDTTSWMNGTSPDAYYDADNVTFNDASTYTTVTLNTTVYPQTVTFTGTSNYTLTGAGKISGASSIVKTGSGTLTINTLNDNVGGTLVSGGVLAYSSAAVAAAVGNITVSGSGSLNVCNVSSLTPFTNEIHIAGSGFNNQGALFATVAPNWEYAVVNKLVLDADASIGTGDAWRWDIAEGGIGGYVQGNGHAITKVGSGEIWIKNVGDAGFGDIKIEAGTLGFQSKIGMGTASGTAYVARGATLGFWDVGTYQTISKNVNLADGATWYLGAGSPVTVYGKTTVAGSAAFANDVALTLSGTQSGTGFVKKGSASLTLLGVQSLSGTTVVTSGNLLLGGSGTLNAVTVAGSSSLVLTTGGTHTINSIVSTASTVAVNGDAVITVGTLVADSLVLGGTTAEEPVTTVTDGAVSAVNAVPEPSTFVLLGIAAAGLGFGWIRRRR